MATLYAENVPDELYEALRARARKNRKSIAAEIVALLEETIPTPRELKRRQAFLKHVLQMQARKAPGPGPFPSTEEMLREDRER